MKRRRPSTRRPGLDDVRYKANRARLKIIGDHICHRCRQPIDLQLRYPHPLSWSADHKIPRVHLQPHDPRNWDIAFLLESHLRCNLARGAKLLAIEEPPAGLNTSIDW